MKKLNFILFFFVTSVFLISPVVAETELTVEAPKVKKESEIPVQLKEAKEAAAPANMATRIWLGIAMIAGTGALSYLVLRKYRRDRQITDQFQMKVLAQHPLGPKKNLAVIRVAGESILIGVTDHHISLIKSLSLLDEDMAEEVPTNFAPVLKGRGQEPLEDNIDSFSLSSIQDVVNRKVKGLRSLS